MIDIDGAEHADRRGERKIGEKKKWRKKEKKKRRRGRKKK